MLKKIVFHPVLFALFPLLSLYITNSNELLFKDVAVTILILEAVTLLAWMGLSRLLRDHVRAGILVSIFLFVFFSFRYILNGFGVTALSLGLLDEARKLVETQDWQLVWLALCLLLYGVIAQRVVSAHWDLSKATLVLNAMALTLILAVAISGIKPLVMVAQAQADPGAAFIPEWEAQVAAEPQILKKTGALPDIYYIILDGYARDDVLADLYQYDNSPFISYLEKKGFYVAEDARANYKQTPLSLGSSLNFMYLDNMASRVGPESSFLVPLLTIIEHNRTFAQLRYLGYEVVSFSTGYPLTEIQTADRTYSPGISPNSYENVLINNTPLSIFMIGEQYEWHRQRILYTLDQLPKIEDTGKPKFVFAHIFAPHPPFVLGKNGEAVYPHRQYNCNDGTDYMEVGSREEYQSGYRDQLAFVTQKVQGAIDGILSRSGTQPIIILQGDHGPGMMLDYASLENSNLWERLSIMNAYYLPGTGSKSLYPGITPVNTFRVIFNEYFGADLPLVADRSFYSPNEMNYLFTDVTDRLQAKK